MDIIFKRILIIIFKISSIFLNTYLIIKNNIANSYIAQRTKALIEFKKYYDICLKGILIN